MTLALLGERVGQDVSVSLSVALPLLVRHPEHLGQDVHRAECRLHLPLAEIVPLSPSLHLLHVGVNKVLLGVLPHLSPLLLPAVQGNIVHPDVVPELHQIFSRICFPVFQISNPSEVGTLLCESCQQVEGEMSRMQESEL